MSKDGWVFLHEVVGAVAVVVIVDVLGEELVDETAEHHVADE